MKKLNSYFYKKSYEKAGVSAEGVHWDSEFSQNIRFKVLTEFIKEDIYKSSILDIGCGFGEYINFLKNKELLFKEYLGIDCEEFMIDICKKRFTNSFKKIDILKDEIPFYDYLVCSGALNLLNKDDFFKAIFLCFQKAQKGFIFNFLTKNSFHNSSVEEIKNYCLTLSSKIKIENSYLNNDCTIFLKK